MTTALSSIQSFAKGDFISGIIKGVGALVGAIKKLFGGGKSIEERISDLFKAFEEGKGTIRTLTKLSGLLSAELNKLAFQGVGNLFNATKILNDNFHAFVDVALEFGDQGVAQIARVVNAAKRAGADMTVINERLAEFVQEAMDALEERNNFLIEQSSNIIDSILGSITGAARLTRQEIEFAGFSIVSAFNAMIEAGLPLSSAIDNIGEAMAALKSRGEEIGADLGDEFGRLTDVMDILSDEGIQGAIEKFRGLADAALAMGNIGIDVSEQFDILTNSLHDTFEQLISGGLTGEEALAQLGPQLQILLDLSQQYGIVVDENTQKLMDEAEALGLVADKGLTSESILIKGFNAVIEALNRVIVALGGVPVMFDQWGQTSGDASEEIIVDIGDIGDEIEDLLQRGRIAFQQLADEGRESARGINDAFEDIDLPDIGPGGGGGTGGTGGAGGGVGGVGGVGEGGGFQRGSDGFIDFGSGTAAVLHGTEQVVTLNQGKSIAGMVSAALSSKADNTDILHGLSVQANIQEEILQENRQLRRLLIDSISRQEAMIDSLSVRD